MSTPTVPSPELRRLDFLVGRWQTAGEILGVAGRAGQISGTDEYEWAAGGFFLLHRVDVMMGEAPAEAIELIGYAASDHSFSLHSFDNQGQFTTMRGRVDPAGNLTISGDKVRSTLRPSPDGRHMQAHWERSEDGATWAPWLEMTFKKL